MISTRIALLALVGTALTLTACDKGNDHDTLHNADEVASHEKCMDDTGYEPVIVNHFTNPELNLRNTQIIMTDDNIDKSDIFIGGSVYEGDKKLSASVVWHISADGVVTGVSENAVDYTDVDQSDEYSMVDEYARGVNACVSKKSDGIGADDMVGKLDDNDSDRPRTAEPQKP